jgi:hypothetical protein
MNVKVSFTIAFCFLNRMERTSIEWRQSIRIAMITFCVEVGEELLLVM